MRVVAWSRPARQLHATTRMVHCFAIAHLMGRPGADAVIDHGMDFIWNGHRDTEQGGYLWGVGYDGPTDDTKQAYGHAFVLLAASSAKVAGHPDADRLLADISEVLMTRFWEEQHGAVAEEFSRDWKPARTYRGQNSNMHLTEALMAAFEATGDNSVFAPWPSASPTSSSTGMPAPRAGGCPSISMPGGTSTWSIPAAPMFRPYGTTPGHWLEWARLLLQLWELGGRTIAWLPEASRALFLQAVGEGWDKEKGGFYYTLEWSGAPRIRDRYWWPCCEGIGAAHVLRAVTGDPVFEDWYRRIWNFSAARFIDRINGGWHPQLDDALRPNADPFFGKPDIYHALQACLIPLLPATGSITRGLSQGVLSLESETLGNPE